MPRIFAMFLMLLLSATLAGTPARAAGLRDVVRTLEAPFQAATPAGQRIQDYTADFFQESRIASLDRLQRARGRVSVRFDYRRGQVPLVMFHWEYQEPTTQELVSDGKTLWVYLPENNQVIQSDIEMVSQAGESNPMTFLTGLGNLSRDFQIGFAEPGRDVAGNYVLDLRPRRTTALLNRMVIVVDRQAVEGAAPQAAAPKAAAPSGAPTAEEFFGQSAARPGRGGLSGGPPFPILSTTVYDAGGNSTTIEFSGLRVNVGLSAGQFRFLLPAGVEVVRPTGSGMGL